MGLDLVKYLVLLITTNIFEAGLLLYGIYFHRDWRMAIIFPIFVPVVISIALRKHKYIAKLLVTVVIILSIALIQNSFALFWGDIGTSLGMMLFSFLFTIIPSALYILAITIFHWCSRKDQDEGWIKTEDGSRVNSRTGDDLREP